MVVGHSLLLGHLKAISQGGERVLNHYCAGRTSGTASSHLSVGGSHAPRTHSLQHGVRKSVFATGSPLWFPPCLLLAWVVFRVSLSLPSLFKTRMICLSLPPSLCVRKSVNSSCVLFFDAVGGIRVVGGATSGCPDAPLGHLCAASSTVSPLTPLAHRLRRHCKERLWRYFFFTSKGTAQGQQKNARKKGPLHAAPIETS